MSDELPQGWVTAPLRDIAEARMGETILAKQLTPTGVPVFSAGQENNPWGFVENPRKPHGKGTVVVSARGSIGFPKVPKAERFASTQTTIALRFPDEELAAYGCLWLKTVDWTALTKGGAIPMLTVGDINELDVPLAPLAEQRRIVAKLETLLGKVDASQQRLAKIPVLLKRFRQSVLAAACSGRLTADWREENENIEAADSLIKNVQFQIGGSEDDLPELPEKWKWVALGNYAHCFRGRFSPRPRNDPRYFDGEHPFIQIGNLPREGGLVDSHVQTLNDEGLAVSRKFPKGTVVIAIVGATIGNTGVLAYDMCVTDSIVGLETGDKVGNRYVELFLHHKKDAIRQSSYSSGGQPNLSLAALTPYPFALPPLPEQQEIVRRVEGLFALADQLELRLAKARGQVDQLTPSLLARAFAGQLVPQDPTDEPAE